MSDIEETYKALVALLSDEKLFKDTVEEVFASIDTDHSGTLEKEEVDKFIEGICTSMGIKKQPDAANIAEVFDELDTDHSKTISKEELGNFLRVLFDEQRKQIEKAMHK